MHAQKREQACEYTDTHRQTHAQSLEHNFCSKKKKKEMNSASLLIKQKQSAKWKWGWGKFRKTKDKHRKTGPQGTSKLNC